MQAAGGEPIAVAARRRPWRRAPAARAGACRCGAGRSRRRPAAATRHGRGAPTAGRRPAATCGSGGRAARRPDRSRRVPPRRPARRRPSRSISTPNPRSSSMKTSTSPMPGRLRSRTGSSLSSAAASAGPAAFLFPATRTVPCRRRPPRTIKRSTTTSFGSDLEAEQRRVTECTPPASAVKCRLARPRRRSGDLQVAMALRKQRSRVRLASCARHGDLKVAATGRLNHVVLVPRRCSNRHGGRAAGSIIPAG